MKYARVALPARLQRPPGVRAYRRRWPSANIVAMEDPHLALRFAIAICLGMLIGLERERTRSEEGGAGVRTFALITLAGAIAGYLERDLGLSWFALVLFIASEQGRYMTGSIVTMDGGLTM